MLNAHPGNSCLSQRTISSVWNFHYRYFHFLPFSPLPYSIPSPPDLLVFPREYVWFRVMQTKWWIECICNGLWKLSQCPKAAQFYPSKCSVLHVQHIICRARKLYEIQKIQAKRIKSKWSFGQRLRWVELSEQDLQKWTLSEWSNADGSYEIFSVASNLTCSIKWSRSCSTVLSWEAQQ